MAAKLNILHLRLFKMNSFSSKAKSYSKNLMLIPSFRECPTFCHFAYEECKFFFPVLFSENDGRILRKGISHNDSVKIAAKFQFYFYQIKIWSSLKSFCKTNTISKKGFLFHLTSPFVVYCQPFNGCDVCM